MKQPVSRNSFHRLRGYLGVHLQEGAPFVDAFWNEGADVQWSLLRDAIRDAGLQGTSGIELRIDPVLDGQGGFVARGGPGRFYCDGLPVLWPTSRLIELHGLEPPPVQQAKGRGEGYDGDWPRRIYLEAWVGVVDSLDLPDLDDPGLGAERGTFRTRVHSQIRVGHPHERRTNVQLTVRGSYGADRNALYRIELVGAHEGRAALLWDSAAASVTALVTERAEAYATEVVLGSTEGFEVGSHVRFEGHGVDPALYRVTGRTANKIAIEGHDCGRVSLVDCTGVSIEETGSVREVVLEGDRTSGPLAQLRRGGRVKDLPANLGKPGAAGGGLIVDVAWEQAPPDELHPDQPRKVTLKLAPDGLTAALDPWNEPRASSLAVHASPFQTCIEVYWPDAAGAQQEWTAGMRVQIRVDPKRKHQGTALAFVETESDERCRPGDATVQMDEVRRVARIVHHQRGAHGEPRGPTMTLILDEPLSSEHYPGDQVVPERPIRARRYEGHACAVPIDFVDPQIEPSRASPTSPYDLGGSQPLVPTGLSLLLSVERQVGEKAPESIVVPGDGWTFAARAGGWIERPIFAPVDEVQRGRAPLAEVRWRDDGSLEVIDVRPVPAPHAHHGWLADIADTADELSLIVPGARAERVAELARRASGKRAQRELVSEVSALVDEIADWASATPMCARACELLRKAVQAVHHAEMPTPRELSRIASAMERLSCAAALVGDGPEPEPMKREAHAPAAAEPAEPAPHDLEPASEGVHEPPVEVPAEPPAEGAPPAAEPGPPAAEAAPPAAEIVDIAGLPTRLVHAIRSVAPSHRRRWLTLRDVPAPAALPRGPERRLAEVVAALLEQTADIGRRALAGEDRAALQTALHALWKQRFELDKLDRPIRVDDAIALHEAPPRATEGKP